MARVAAAAALAAVALLAGLALAAPPDLTGSWFNVDAPTAPAWQLRASADRNTLTATWVGGPGHSGLRGSFTGTLNSAETAYVGTLHITEGSIDTGGTMTFAITGPDSVNVIYQQDNGPNGTIRFARDPVFATTGSAAPVSGTVLFRVPGSTSFISLGAVAEIPVGSTVDTRRGRVRIVIQNAKGVLQASDFYGGQFVFTQPRGLKGIANMRLVGGDFSVCGSGAARAAGVVPGKSVRKLWGNGAGKFRTTGRYSSATIRGTTWLTDDRCNGTLTRVTKGSVTVRDFARKRSVVVKAPRSYFARR